MKRKVVALVVLGLFLVGATPYITKNIDLYYNPKRVVLTLDQLDGTAEAVDATHPVPVSGPAGGITVTQGTPGLVTAPWFVRLSDGAAALIGQKTMAASLPVTVASDQSNLPAVPGNAAGDYSLSVSVADNTAAYDINPAHTLLWATVCCSDRNIWYTIGAQPPAELMSGECHTITNTPAFTHIYIDTLTHTSAAAASVRILHAGYTS